MSVKVSDDIHVLTGPQRAELEGIGSPQVVKVLFENPDSKPALHDRVKSCVDTPNTICIGVSPKLRHTWTEIGLDTGIRSGDYDQVGRAGNVDFKAAVGGEQEGWMNGVKAIISRAQILAHHETSVGAPVILQQPQTVVEHPVSATPFVVGFGVLTALVGGCWYVIRKQQKRTEEALENAQRETAELASRNLREEQWADEIKKRVDPVAAAPAKRATPAIQKLPKRKSTWDDVLERAKPRTPGPSVVVVPQAPLYVPIPEPIYTRRDPTPAPVYRRDPTPEPRRRDDTPAPSFSSSSSFDFGSGGGGGGDFGSSSGGGGGGDF